MIIDFLCDFIPFQEMCEKRKDLGEERKCLGDSFYIAIKMPLYRRISIRYRHI